jgi:integrase
MSGPKSKGSITTLPNGRALMRVTIGGKLHQGRFDTEEEAQIALDVLLREKAPGDDKTFGAYSRRWFDARELRGVVKHVKKERSTWDAHVRTWECYEWPLDRIRRKHIAAFLASMEKKTKRNGEPIGRGVAKHLLSLIRACLRSAADEGLIDANPAMDIDVPRRAGGPRKWTYLELEEIERVFVAEHADRKDTPHLTLERRAAYAIAIYAGLRKSEIWRLRWEDIAIGGQRPSIHVREGKSDHAVRDVPLLPQAAEHVRRWRERDGVSRAFGLAFSPRENPRSARTTHGDDYDAGWRDHPYTYRGVRKVRQGAASRCGFGRRVRFHDLRHTCASHLVMGSWTPEPMTIQQARRWLGHSSTSVTDRYAHMGSEGLHAAIESEHVEPCRNPDDRDASA